MSGREFLAFDGQTGAFHFLWAADQQDLLNVTAILLTSAGQDVILNINTPATILSHQPP
jgi:hypothetical protein